MKEVFKNLYEAAVQNIENGNYTEAIATLSDLAAQGYAETLYLLGLCYGEGKGV